MLPKGRCKGTTFFCIYASLCLKNAVSAFWAVNPICQSSRASTFSDPLCGYATVLGCGVFEKHELIIVSLPLHIVIVGLPMLFAAGGFPVAICRNRRRLRTRITTQSVGSISIFTLLRDGQKDRLYRMPHPLSLFTFHFSLFPFHFSLFTFHLSLFPPPGRRRLVRDTHLTVLCFFLSTTQEEGGYIL